MSQPNEISAILAEHIQGQLIPAAAELTLTPDYPLIESGLIDSLTLFRLVTFLQERFKVRIRPDEIVVENFATLFDMVRLVESKQAESAP